MGLSGLGFRGLGFGIQGVEFRVSGFLQGVPSRLPGRAPRRIPVRVAMRVPTRASRSWVPVRVLFEGSFKGHVRGSWKALSF